MCIVCLFFFFFQNAYLPDLHRSHNGISSFHRIYASSICICTPLLLPFRQATPNLHHRPFHIIEFCCSIAFAITICTERLVWLGLRLTFFLSASDGGTAARMNVHARYMHISGRWNCVETYMQRDGQTTPLSRDPSFQPSTRATADRSALGFCPKMFQRACMRMQCGLKNAGGFARSALKHWAVGREGGWLRLI